MLSPCADLNFDFMKEIFDIKRFGRYIASDLKGCTANFGLNLLTISLLGVIAYFVSSVFHLVIGDGWHSTGEATRWTIFLLASAILLISMPIKCYGHITDRKSGAAWLMLPASTFEKFLSMILNCLVIIPAAFFIVYIGCDLLLCTADKSIGTALINTSAAHFIYGAEIPDGLSKTLHPITAIDDIFSIILVFLLGGLCFKRSKAAKTILVLIGIGMAASIILTPVFINFFAGSISNLQSLDSEMILNRINGLAWIDTVSDLVVLAGLLVTIFFRLKTIKH